MPGRGVLCRHDSQGERGKVQRAGVVGGVLGCPDSQGERGKFQRVVRGVLGCRHNGQGERELATGVMGTVLGVLCRHNSSQGERNFILDGVS